MPEFKEGVCPVCGSTNVEYGELESKDDELFYSMVCADCDSIYKEFYKLVHLSTTIIKNMKEGGS